MHNLSVYLFNFVVIGPQLVGILVSGRHQRIVIFSHGSDQGLVFFEGLEKFFVLWIGSLFTKTSSLRLNEFVI